MSDLGMLRTDCQRQDLLCMYLARLQPESLNMITITMLKQTLSISSLTHLVIMTQPATSKSEVCIIAGPLIQRHGSLTVEVYPKMIHTAEAVHAIQSTLAATCSKSYCTVQQC